MELRDVQQLHLLLPLPLPLPQLRQQQQLQLNLLPLKKWYKITILNFTKNFSTYFQIRQCTCTESEECITKAWPSITSCQEKCKSKLAFFGNDTDFGLKCIKNNPKDADLINTCFKTIPGYCAKTNDSQIEKPTYEVKSANKVKVVEHEIVATFRAFHMCAGECMKDIILECFEEKECGVVLGESQDIGKIGEFCPVVKSSIITASAKSLPCIYPGLKRRGKNNKKQ